ncbi:MAG: hypothetical protein ACI8O8_002846 [Oleiphilaceae bacterium]|jgi:hypothetical protein
MILVVGCHPDKYAVHVLHPKFYYLFTRFFQNLSRFIPRDILLAPWFDKEANYFFEFHHQDIDPFRYILAP